MDSEKHWELVNLKDDPFETKDLAKEKPGDSGKTGGQMGGMGKYA